jgi:hypothetical protein
VSCHGFFHVGHKEFGNLIRDCTIAIDTSMEQKIQRLSALETDAKMGYPETWALEEGPRMWPGYPCFPFA